MWGPAVWMRGPRRPSAAIVARRSAKYSSHWPGSRNAVTPLASWRSASFVSGGELSIWKCASTRPGRIVRPDRSTRSAPAGTGTDAGRANGGDAFALDDDAGVVDRRAGRCRPQDGACSSTRTRPVGWAAAMATSEKRQLRIGRRHREARPCTRDPGSTPECILPAVPARVTPANIRIHFQANIQRAVTLSRWRRNARTGHCPQSHDGHALSCATAPALSTPALRSVAKRTRRAIRPDVFTARTFTMLKSANQVRHRGGRPFSRRWSAQDGSPARCPPRTNPPEPRGTARAAPDVGRRSASTVCSRPPPEMYRACRVFWLQHVGQIRRRDLEVSRVHELDGNGRCGIEGELHGRDWFVVIAKDDRRHRRFRRS